MKNLYLRDGPFPDGFFDGAVARILELQRPNGAIPWYDGGVWDPWNHTEAAMGLATAGETEAALRAFRHLAETQHPDGAWWGQYGSAAPLEDDHYAGDGEEKRIRDTNFVAYPAVGIWHYYLLTNDLDFLRHYWPMVERATDWVVALQSDEGDIRWAADDPGTPEDDALITGCSSIYKSLECAIHIAEALGIPRPDWALARARLGHCLRTKPHRFDRTWDSKANYSMDWYYPVLAGALRGERARMRLSSRWDEFVVPEMGCRCVVDAPWVTMAEAGELTMALVRAGQKKQAIEVLSWQHRWRDDTGAYWMGYQYAEQVPWPTERPAWTAGAILLAADAVYHATPAHRIFVDVLDEPQQAVGGLRQF